MHDPQRFRRLFAVRILGLVGALAPAQVGCSTTHAATAPDAGTGEASRGSPETGMPADARIESSRVDARDRGDATPKDGTTRFDAPTSGDAGGPVDGTVHESGMTGVDATATKDGPTDATSVADADGSADAGDGASLFPITNDCFTWPIDGGPGDAAVPDAAMLDGGACPTNTTEVLNVFLNESCPRGFEPRAILSGPMPGTISNDCCYTVQLIACGPGGRPYLVDDRARLATVEQGNGGNGWSAREKPSLGDLTAGERASLSESWASAALFEHASVASFARFSLDLMAVGAPSELVARAHEAALDEIHHARLCFALAAAYAGSDVAPGSFPVGNDARLEASLASLATSTVVEGCIGETVAAIVASEQLASATDPTVRAALERISADEARHAELAWSTVAWAVRTGGREISVAVERAFALALGAGDPADTREATSTAPLVASTLRLEGHGLLSVAARTRAVRDAMRDVVAPAARALLRQFDRT